MSGALFSHDDDSIITGWLTIGNDHYELVGVKRSKIRTDLKARKIEPEQQRDMFDDGSGDGAS